MNKKKKNFCEACGIKIEHGLRNCVDCSGGKFSGECMDCGEIQYVYRKYCVFCGSSRIVR